MAEDEFDIDLKKYRLNLGRSNKEISDMDARIEAATLKNINATLKDME